MEGGTGKVGGRHFEPWRPTLQTTATKKQKKQQKCKSRAGPEEPKTVTPITVTANICSFSFMFSSLFLLLFPCDGYWGDGFGITDGH